ncbi:hypothetical protein BHE74_00030527 [Ensete ventricosum]|nr:hypothetical protein BHE74_00030527 [Ensete ventricosum]
MSPTGSRNLESVTSLATHELQRALQHRPRVPERQAPLRLPVPALDIASSSPLSFVHHHNVQQLGHLRHLREPSRKIRETKIAE